MQTNETKVRDEQNKKKQKEREAKRKKKHALITKKNS